MLPHVTHLGVPYRKHIWLEMRVHTATTPLPTTTTLGRNLSSLPQHELIIQRSARRKIWDRKRGKWWTGLSPSNTRMKLVARRLAQQLETGIRQTGSTTANFPCNLPLQTQQSHPPIKPNRAKYCSSGVVIPPSSLSAPNRCVSRLHPHIFSCCVSKSTPAIEPRVEHQP